MDGKPISTGKKIVFSIVILAFLLVILELSAYFYWEKWDNHGVDKNIILALCGQEFNPPKYLPNTFWHHDLNPENKDYQGYINSQGTKGEEFQAEKPFGQLRVICLGDSTTEGIDLPPDQTYPFFLERYLERSIVRSSEHSGVQVINAGVSSHNSAFSLAYLTFRLIHFDPDIVVIKSGYNDYLPYVIPQMQKDYTHAFPRPYAMQMASHPVWSFARYSYALKLLGYTARRNDVLNPYHDFTGTVNREILERFDYNSNRNRFDIYSENLRSMIAICRVRKITPYILDLPVSANDKHFSSSEGFRKNFRKLMEEFERECRRICREENVKFITTAPLPTDVFADHCHLFPKGNDIIARKVAEVISRDQLNPDDPDEK